MDKPLIYLAFTDDWELRGNGSGDINSLQFDPMQKLLAIFEKHGARCTFMAEMMQQLIFRANQEEHSQLKPLADAWDEHVREAFSRGHDVQLHIHTQWSDAKFESGQWRLNGDWSLLNYKPAAAEEMIANGKAYLEDLLRPLSADYLCVAFRASYLAIAPSVFALNLLAKYGIVFDASIVGGLRVNTKNISLDYTHCEEDFLPFYPQMNDARKLSDKQEPIVCVPIFHFTGSRRRVTKQIICKIRSAAAERLQANAKNPSSGSSTSNDGIEIDRSSLPARIVDKIIKPALFGKHLTADIGQLGLPLLQEMIEKIRERARASGESEIPLILTNHTKNMKNFEEFDRFLGELSKADDIRFITLTELAEKLRAREFNVRKAA